MTLIQYNFCIVRQKDSILLLNRESPSWMGCWNGVGGKVEPGEGIRDSMRRELREETGLTPPDLDFKGLITWSTPRGAGFGGMYVYSARIPDDLDYPTPVKIDEGILDWKSVDWILHPKNHGVAVNIQKFLRLILDIPHPLHHHCVYEGDLLSEFESSKIDAGLEEDADARTAYLNGFIHKRFPLERRTGLSC